MNTPLNMLMKEKWFGHLYADTYHSIRLYGTSSRFSYLQHNAHNAANYNSIIIYQLDTATHIHTCPGRQTPCEEQIHTHTQTSGPRTLYGSHSLYSKLRRVAAMCGVRAQAFYCCYSQFTRRIFCSFVRSCRHFLLW